MLQRATFACFNSIRVRLKPFPDLSRDWLLLFQFHKGTIKTVVVRLALALVLVFQFHKGTIKTIPLMT